MGHSIPVFYLTCEKDESPASRHSWDDAQQILEKAFQDKERYHLYQATGRNWWQLEAITEIRNRDGLDGLEFLDHELGIIGPEMLPTAIQSLQKVISARQAMGQIGPRSEALSEQDIDCDSEGGLDSFLFSLLSVLEIAEAQNRCVVFVQPQP